MHTIVFEEFGRLRIIETPYYDAYLAILRALRRDGIHYEAEEPR